MRGFLCFIRPDIHTGLRYDKTIQAEMPLGLNNSIRTGCRRGTLRRTYAPAHRGEHGCLYRVGSRCNDTQEISSPSSYCDSSILLYPSPCLLLRRRSDGYVVITMIDNVGHSLYRIFWLAPYRSSISNLNRSSIGSMTTPVRNGWL